MSRIGRRIPHTGSHRARISTSSRGAAVASLIVWAALFAGCTKDDTGTCCTLLAGRTAEIPAPDPGPDGEPRNTIRIDPAFDCEDFTCVSYQGSQAYCTRECAFDDGCPEGFSCLPVIQSDPGPGSNIGPDDKFCVRAQTECLKE